MLTLNIDNQELVVELFKRKLKEMDSLMRPKYKEKDDNFENAIKSVEDNLPSNLNAQLKKRLIDVVTDHRQIYCSSPGLIKGYSYKLNVTDETPFFQRNYPIPHHKKPLVDQEIKQLLSDNVIELGFSSYISPLVCVTKRDGSSIRLCTDGRLLNKRLMPDYEQTLLIEDIFKNCYNKMVFSTIDLTKSFYQVELDKESRKYTAFIFEGRTYQFQRVPFGLKISSAALNRAMNCGLKPHVQTYIDDMLLISQTYEEHVELIKIVFERLKANNITINLQKSVLFRKELSFVGHILTPNGILPQPDKIQSIQDARPPSNKKELKSFIGLTNYYQKFINNYADKMGRLNNLLKKDTKWHWAEEENKLFNEIKETFLNKVVLSHPDFNEIFYLQTDSSHMALGAQLFQIINKRKRVVQFASRILRGAKIYYTVTEKEFLAIVWSVKKFITYLSGHHFIIQTDHKALKFINQCKSPTARIQRWILFLQQFNFDIEYVKGSENSVADYLSRYCHNKENDEFKKQIEINYIQTKNKDELKKMVKQFQNYYEELKNELSKDESKYYSRNKTWFFKKDGHTDRIVVPEKQIKEMIILLHQNHGHLGIQKTFHLINRYFYIKNLWNLVNEIVKKCYTCQLCKITNHTLQNEYVYFNHDYPLEIIYMDFLGPLPCSTSKFKYILTIVDGFSRFAKLYAITAASTRTAIKGLDQFCEEYGTPEKVVTDNGTQFTGKLWHEELVKKGIQTIYTSIRHSQSNKAERVHRDIGEYLRVMLENKKQTTWPKLLNKIEYLINNTYHSTIGGYPIETFMGIRSRMLDEEVLKEDFGLNRKEQLEKEEITRIRENVRKRVTDIGEKNKLKHKMKYEYQTFKVDDLVLIKSLRIPAHKGQISKLLPIWEGPYVVCELRGNGSYLLKDPKSGKLRGKFHVNLMKTYHP